MVQDKKILIYEAALSLVDETHDFSQIKVADIAERANIGKGTVYEYFDSKEEVIGEALIFMFTRGIETLELLVKGKKGFKETYKYLLRNLNTIMSKNRNLFNFMTMNQRKLDFHTTIKSLMYKRLEQLRKSYFEIIEKLVDMSLEEGIIKEKPSRFEWQTAVLCSMTCLVVHHQLEEDFSAIPEEEVLEKAYNIYLKLLNN